ncbi:uncharacterized protein LOC133184410 [Saccostrea echinata]|uniref:uncharacterized protein LOC133184410 n=1 Tax=Saccostrea echinata TaxID=191078 RepID=UPI002A8203CC|nr:uncharacterized protein LOC133184410 [Saccostrea echinata]
MTPALCATKCGSFKFNYAAVTQGQFCFCGNSLPPLTEKDVSEANCSDMCVGNTSIKCGGPDYVNVYSTSPPIVGLEITPSVSLIETGNDVSFAPSYESAGEDLTFQLDYGDDGGKTDKNQSAPDMWTTKYFTPGRYQITLFGNDNQNSIVEKEATTAVLVEARPHNASLSCPDNAATHEETICILTVMAGTNLELTVDIDGVQHSKFYISDPPIYTAGPAFISMSSSLLPGEVTSDFVIMPASEIQQDGTLIGFEYYTHTAGAVNFYILRPSCADYCFDSNQCTGTCENLYERTCSPGLQFCPASGACWDYISPTCASPTTRYSGAQRTDLTQVAAIPHTLLASPAYDYLSIDLTAYNIKVKPGDIVAYKSLGGVLKSFSSSSQDSDLKSANFLSLANAVSLSSPKRHLLRAVVSAGIDVKLPFTFSTFGSKTVGVLVKNNDLAASLTLSEVMNIIEGIDMCALDLVKYAENGSPVQFQVLPHTGTSIIYTWDHGDSSTTNVTTLQHTYTYTTPGTFPVNVTCSNALSSKSNYTTIKIETRINGLSLSASPAVTSQVTSITLGMTNGSDYMCEWKKNGVQFAMTTSVTTPPNDNFDHIFTEDGTYEITVTCSNNINSQTVSVIVTAQRKITGLALVRAGALLNTPYTVDFVWDDGSNPQFLLEFNGVLQTLSIDTFARKGSSPVFPAEASITSFPMNLTAYNLVSNEQITTNFGIESEIAGMRITSDSAINPTLGFGTVAKDDVVTLTISATGGTNVNIQWEHTVGNSPPSVTPQNIPTWTTNVSKLFTLSTLGNHELKVSVSNAYSSNTSTFSYLAIAPVKDIQFNTISPVLFLPPADVVFTFSQSPVGLPPNEATIEIDYGDGRPVASLPFLLTNSYPYSYREDGTFTVTANISNIVSHQIVTTTVEVVEKIVDLVIEPEPPHAPRNDPVDLRVKMKRGGTGAKLQLRWKIEGTWTPYQNRMGSSPDGFDSKLYTYTTIGSDTIQVEAKSALETKTATYTIFCEEKVTDNFQLTSTFPQDFALIQKISYTITYDDPIPTNAKQNIDYGDGTTASDVAFPIMTQGGSKTWDFTYSEAGHYSTTFTLFNKVSSVTKTVMSGIYRKFVGCDAVLKWKPIVPLNGSDLDGFGPSKNIFPRDRPLRVHITCTAGTLVYYDVFAQGTVNFLACNKTEKTLFELDFTSLAAETYTLSIKPINPIHQVTITKSIEMQDPCKDIIVDDGGLQASAYQWKKFNITFGMQGTATCLHVDFGDGTPGELYGDASMCSTFTGPAPYIGALSNITEVQHEYMTMDTFIVFVRGFNAYSSCSANFTHVISDVDCSQPKVSIKDLKPVFYNPEEVKRSAQVRIVGVTDIYCTQTLDNVKTWTVHKIDENTGEDVQEIDITNLPSHQTAELALPPRFLDYGSYRTNYRMEMVSTDFVQNENFSANVDHYIRVVKSDLVAIVYPGGMTKIQRGFAKMITIEPETYSFDPDVATGFPQTFSNFTWWCRRNDETFPSPDVLVVPYTTTQLGSNPADNGGCFKQGPGRIDTYNGTLSFDTANMQINQTYVFKIQVQKDDRMTETTAELEIVAGDPPDLTISCGTALCIPRQGGQLVRPSSRLSLLSECSGCTPGTQFEWKIYQSNYQWTWKEILQLPTYVDGVNSNSIAIRTSMFDLDKTVKTYLVELHAKREDGQQAKAYMKLFLNDPPRNGTCTISPIVGVATVAIFEVTCSGWIDEDGIDSYRIYVTFKDDPQERLIIYGSVSSYSVQLPVGPDYDENKMQVFVRIADVYGAAVDYNIGIVQVKPMARDEVVEKLGAMQVQLKDELDLALARADLSQVNEVALMYASMINMASKNGTSEYAGVEVAGTQTATGLGPDYVNRTGAFDKSLTTYEKEEKYQTEREVYAQITNQIADALQRVTIATPSSIALTASTCAEVTKYTENCARSCQEGIENVTLNMMNTLEAQADEIPIEELTLAAKGIINTLSNLIEAGNVHTEYPTNGDMESVAPFAHYDTDLESVEKAIPSSITNRERANKKVLAYTNEDFQASTTQGVQRTADSVYSKLRTIFQKSLVEGETPVKIFTTSIVLSFEKNRADQFSNKTISLGDGSFDMPDWCSLKDTCNPNDTVVLQSSYSIFHPHAFTPQAKDLSKYSGSLSIDLYDASDSPIQVTQAVTPIQMKVPLDRNMLVPGEEYVIPFIPDRDWEYFFYHTTEITSSRAALQVRFRLEDLNLQFLVLVKFGDIKNISTEFDHVCMVPSKMEYKGLFGTDSTPDPYTCFVGSDVINGYQGQVTIGVRQMSGVEHDYYISKSHVPPTFPPGSGAFSTNYTIQTVSSTCRFFNETIQDWDTRGCEVGPLTNRKHIHCVCTHMTTFAGGWVVVPNTIDWNFVFSNMDFFKNPTLYITEIVIFVVYTIAVIWARYKDKKDIEMLGLTPLEDNDKKDKYYYEIVVVTGMRRKAGTDSNVSFILSGDEDETDVRTFSDKKRKIFRRGGVDGFLMSVPRPLGALNYLHIWHDNSGKGKFASWYLRNVVLRDVQTDQKYIFICNRWLAVEEDDGMIDRLIPVAGKEQMTEFSHLFTEKTTKSLSDGHLWFSVIARPPQSRFTRAQRVSCCLCLLFMSMLTNAMFYEKGESDNNAFTFGPFALTPEQIYIGVVSNIIVFPVNFLVILIFRKSRPRNKRPSRVAKALNEKSKPVASVFDVHPTLKGSNESGCLTPSKLIEGARPETAITRSGTSMSVVDLAENGNKKKKKKTCDLPWYFVIIGWILLWTATLVSAAFVTFYGVMFQDIKCKMWITSMLISFFTSIFITQPIKVILTAIFFSLVIKNPGGDDDEENNEDEEKPPLAPDEEYLHDIDNMGFVKPRKAAYKPPDPRLLEKAREVRLKEIKMWGVVREIVFYSFFLWILMVISYRNRSYMSYYYKSSLEKVFINTNDTKHHFLKIKNKDDFWVWAQSGMVDGIRAGVWYNDGQPVFLRGYINDKQSRIMGYATMRQLRVKPGSCRVADAMQSIVHECNDEYDMREQDEENYGIGWNPVYQNATYTTEREEYSYTEPSVLDGYPYMGDRFLYSGGGYVVRLRGNSTLLRTKLHSLERDGWIDKYTRAIFVEFTVYNPGINLFGIATLLLEVRPSQGIFPSYRFEPAMLLPYMTDVMLFQIACEIVYFGFTVFFIFQLFRGMLKEKLAYFKQFWNLVELGICSMSVTAIVIYFYRMFETNRLTERFKVSHGNEYMKFQYVGAWSELFSYIIGWLVFFASLKFLKLLRFNKRMSLLASTLKNSCKDLMHFSIIFSIVFLAFIQLFYLVYAGSLTSFKTFITACESGLTMMMGKFDIYDMKMVEPVMTPFFIFAYVVTITFIVVNMLLSILNETFGAVRSDIAKQNNEYEIVDFMMNRFKLWTGLGMADRGVLSPDDVRGNNTIEGTIDLFPDRIEQLLSSLSHIYSKEERLDALFEMNAAKREDLKTSFGRLPPTKSQKYQDVLTTVHTNY